MDNKEVEKQTKLKEFQRRFPVYINAKRVVFPIMDEILVQYSLIFPQSNQFGRHPEGSILKSFSAVPLTQLIEITTFLNSFPQSTQFAAMSESQSQFSILLTPLLKMTGYLIRDMHTVQTFSACNLYSTLETQEQADRLNFKLVAFFVEDIFKYKLGLLKPIDIAKQRQIKEEMKKEKKVSKQKASLLQIIEKQPDEEKEIDMSKYEFENYLDPTSQNFWKIIYEAFYKVIRKSQKSKTQDMEIEDDSDQGQPMNKGAVNQENIEIRRQQIMREYQILSKQKDQNKKKSKLTKQYSQMKSFKIKDKFSDPEMSRFNYLYRFLINCWPALLLQSIKLPYVRSLFTDVQLDAIKKLGETEQGYFKCLTKERSQIMSSMIEAITETDSFKTIVEYRQELTEAVGGVLESVQMELYSINNSVVKKDGQHTYSQQQQYRRVFKQYLQLVEFNRLFVNGSLFLGSDVHGFDYYIFSHDIEHVYQNKIQEWRILNDKEIIKLQQSLNVNGVKERELQTNLQKLIACELYNDPETKELLNFVPVEQKNTQQGNKNIKQLIIKTLQEVEQTYTQILMIKHLRWESHKNRQQLQMTIRTLDNIQNMANIIKILVEQFDTAYQLKLDQSKFTNSNEQDQKDLRTFAEKITLYAAKGIKFQQPEEILFNDFELFQMMESKDFIKPTGIKTSTKFWQQSLGIEVRDALIAFGNKVDKNGYYDVLFMANTLLLAVHEYDMTLSSQSDNKELEEIKQVVKNIQQETYITDKKKIDKFEIVELD